MKGVKSFSDNFPTPAPAVKNSHSLSSTLLVRHLSRRSATTATADQPVSGYFLECHFEPAGVASVGYLNSSLVVMKLARNLLVNFKISIF
jgi:hypothetical protein